MPHVDWQTVAVIAVVAGAMIYITRAVRRAIGSRRASTGCGTCGSCPSNAATTPMTSRPIVTIDAIKAPHE